MILFFVSPDFHGLGGPLLVAAPLDCLGGPLDLDRLGRSVFSQDCLRNFCKAAGSTSLLIINDKVGEGLLWTVAAGEGDCWRMPPPPPSLSCQNHFHFHM